MKKILICLLFVHVYSQTKDTSPALITVDNQTDNSVYAAVYCDPLIFGSTTTREFDPVEIGAHTQEPVQRPRSAMGCNRYLVIAHSAQELMHQLTKNQFQQLTTIGIGTTTLGRLFDYFYITKKDGAFKLYNPFTYLASGKITTLKEFSQTQAARIVEKDSILIQDNPYKNMQATVRIGADINPDEKIYVNKRSQTAKKALEQFTGKKLNNKPVTIATINSGGGTRALTCMLGFHIALQNIGLLDAVMYDVGLSGGAWFVSLWIQSHKKLSEFKKELRKIVKLGSSFLVEKPSRKLTKQERHLFVDALLVRAALAQPVTLVNLWGSLLGVRYLEPYGNNRESIRFSRALSGDFASQYPFPILSAVNAYNYDDVPENRVKMNWYEFTPYEVGGVSDWLGNVFVPTWAFGRSFENKVSKDFNPEYDLGLLMGIWGSAFAVSYARIYEEIVPGLSDVLQEPLNFIRKKLDDSWVKFQGKKVSVAKVHNFTRMISATPAAYREKEQLRMADSGIAFNLPYPAVSGHGHRKGDILIFFDASGGRLDRDGAAELLLVEQYARQHGLKFPVLPKGQAFVDATKKPVAIFRDEEDSAVPLVIYVSRVMDRESVAYDSSIPKDFSTSFDTLKLYYTESEFDQLSLVAQQNIESYKAAIKEAIIWKLEQLEAFA